MPISCECKHCNKSLSVRDEWAGRSGVCPNCRNPVEIPAVAPEPVPTSVATPKHAPPIASSPPAASSDSAVAASPSAKSTTSRPQPVAPAQQPNATERQPARPLGAPGSAPRPAAVDSTAKLTPEQIQKIRQQVIQCVKGTQLPEIEKHADYHTAVTRLYLVMFALPCICICGTVLCAAALIYFTGVLGLLCIAPLGFVLMLMAGFVSMRALMFPSSKISSVRTLTYEGEPFLHQFVHQLCLMMGAPAPIRIEVDYDLNASASMEDEGLVLRLGLPLVAGLSMNQCVGVMSHEIGHFTQTQSMRSLKMMSRFSQWAAAAFDDRDGMSEWLAFQVASGNPLFLVPQMMWWMVRLMFVIMMRVMCIFIGGMMQKMEYDADRYETSMVGSPTFETTCYQLHYLNRALKQSFEDLQRFNRQKKLVDNLPKMIVRNSKRLSEPVRDEVHREVQNEQTVGLTATHPPDFLRIQASKQDNMRGIFNVPAPSSALFNDFDQLCKNVTWDLYRRYLGTAFKPTDMHSLDDLFDAADQADAAAEKVEERFAGVFHAMRPMRNTTAFIDGNKDTKQRLQDLKLARSKVTELNAAYFQARAEFDVQIETMLRAEHGLAGLTCKMYDPGENHDVLKRGRDDALRGKVAANTKLNALESSMVAAEEFQGNRIMAALDLVASGNVRFSGWEDVEEQATDVLFAIQALASSLAHVRNLQVLLAGQKSALEHLREGNVPNDLVNLILETNARIHRTIGQMRQSLDAAKYPMAGKADRDTVTLGGYLGTHRFGNEYLGAIDDPGELCEISDQFLSDFLNVHRQLAGYLAETVEKIETKIGFGKATRKRG